MGCKRVLLLQRYKDSLIKQTFWKEKSQKVASFYIIEGICRRWVKFRIWFKHGLKAQKLLATTRPERAEAPSPGHHLGYQEVVPLRPVRAKALNICCFITNFIWDLQETISLLNHLSTFRNQLWFHLIVDFCFSINVNAIILFCSFEHLLFMF